MCICYPYTSPSVDLAKVLYFKVSSSKRRVARIPIGIKEEAEGHIQIAHCLHVFTLWHLNKY